MRHTPRYIYFITFVATLGGLLFGYDTGVIAGAVGAVNNEFGLAAAEGGSLWDSIRSGWAVSCALIGAIIGVTLVGPLSDRFGRKPIMLIAAALLTISAIASYFPRSLPEFVIARMLGGVGVGIASMLSPMYIAEIAPRQIRGRLVALNQLALIFGMFTTSCVNFSLQQSMGSADAAWRWMFGAEAIPALIFFIALFFVPESPRWLLQRGQHKRAEEILGRIGDKDYAEEQRREVFDSGSDDTLPKLSEFFAQPGLKKALLVGVILACIVQFSGINTVMYYTTEILKTAGESETQAFLKTMLLNGVNLFCSILAVIFIEKIGRRFLLMSALGGMGLFLVGLGLVAKFPDAPTNLSFVMLLGYVACFMFGLGPGFWALVSEIYPTRFRGRALSFVTLSTWASVFVISQTFPMLEAGIGTSYTYWTYGAVAFGGLLFVMKFVFETKGKSFDEIEQFWKTNSKNEE